MASTRSRLREASATSLICSGRLSRPTCLPVAGSSLNPNLRSDDHLSPEGREGFAHEFFVRERAVDLGGVEEGDAALDGRPKQLDHLLPVLGRTVAEAHPHAAQAEGRNLQAAFPQFTLLHNFLLQHAINM